MVLGEPFPRFIIINVFKIILLLNSVIFGFRFTLAKYYHRFSILCKTGEWFSIKDNLLTHPLEEQTYCHHRKTVRLSDNYLPKAAPAGWFIPNLKSDSSHVEGNVKRNTVDLVSIFFSNIGCGVGVARWLLKDLGWVGWSRIQEVRPPVGNFLLFSNTLPKIASPPPLVGSDASSFNLRNPGSATDVLDRCVLEVLVLKVNTAQAE